MGHIFLSYSRKDTDVMQRVRDDLRTRGLKVWTDENLKAGTLSWKKAIETAIEDADGLAVILSPDAKRSVWVERELDYATMYNVPIFPLLARGDERNAVPIVLVNAQYVDIRVDYVAGIKSIIDAIFDGLKNSAQTDATNKDYAELQPRRGTDNEIKVSISLEEAYSGTKRTHRIDDLIIRYVIPAGADTGTKIRLKGQGQLGVNGGEPGDLYVLVQAEPHFWFERKGNDLHTDVKIPEETLREGGEVPVKTLAGSVSLKIPAGTQIGTIFRLRSRGMPIIRSNNEYGDLYVHVKDSSFSRAFEQMFGKNWSIPKNDEASHESDTKGI